MTVKELIEELQEHNPEAEVHIVNDRGYYEYVLMVSCYDAEDTIDEETNDIVYAARCDGSCKKDGPVVLSVD